MTTRIGILSAASRQASACRELLDDMPGVTFAGVTEPDADVPAEGAMGDVPRHETDELLADVDAVLVCGPYTRRAASIERAAEAGVDVLCEPPLAPSVADATAIRDSCTEANVELGMLLPLRFSEPAVRANAVMDAVVGELQQAVGVNRRPLRDRHDVGWTADPEYAQGGAVMSRSPHLVDLIRWLTDEEVEEVFAELGHMHGLDVEDTTHLCLTLTDGTPFVLDSSWTTPESDDISGEARIDLLGDGGTVSVDCYGQTFKFVTAETGVQQTYWGADATAAAIEDFVEAIELDRPPEATATDGLRQVEVIEAAYASSRDHEPVRVDRRE